MSGGDGYCRIKSLVQVSSFLVLAVLRGSRGAGVINGGGMPAKF